MVDIILFYQILNENLTKQSRISILSAHIIRNLNEVMTFGLRTEAKPSFQDVSLAERKAVTSKII